MSTEALSSAPPAPGLRLGLRGKFFLALLLVAGAMVLSMAAAANWSFTRGFLGHLNALAIDRMDDALPRIRAAYVEQGSWDFLRGDRRVWFSLLRPPMPEAERPSQHWENNLRAPPASDLTGAGLRLSLLDAQGHWICGYPTVDGDAVRRPVVVDGRTVGYVSLTLFEGVAAAGAERFQTSQQRATAAMGACALALAALLAWWLARQLLAPIRQVAQATHRLAGGDHDVRVAVTSHDEAGRLAADFNQLAETLARNAALRREFFADVSHELRTPLAVLKGELEALEDGVRQPTPAALGSLQGEVGMLQQLVDDLHDLSLADRGSLTYRMQRMDLRELVASVVTGLGPRLAEAGLRWRCELPEAPVWIEGDESRLRQLLGNLLENARRYTQPDPALPEHLVVRLQRDGEQVLLEVMDAPPGVPPDDLPHLFDRFFRLERSRSRVGGGSGLGLAICRAIVQAHGGQVDAVASPLGGLNLRVRLPGHA
jgi:two-component system sensor histidine kinase BaeS